MKHSLQVTLSILCLFLISQYIGLAVLHTSIDSTKTKETGQVQYNQLPTIGPVQIERPDITPEFSFWYITAAILIGTLVMLALMRLGWARWIKAWFFVALSITLTLSISTIISGGIAFLISILLAIWRVFKPNVIVHNLTELFTYPGLALIFVPVLNLNVMLLLLVVISIYDMYAVWKSKHMVRMAKFQASTGVFPGLLLQYSSRKDKKNSEHIQMNVEPELRSITKGGHSIRTAILGGGDIAFPLLFAGTVIKDIGFLQALIIPVFAGAGLLVLFLIAKPKKFYPAMPFITVGCLLGLCVAWLI